MLYWKWDKFHEVKPSEITQFQYNKSGIYPKFSLSYPCYSIFLMNQCSETQYKRDDTAGEVVTISVGNSTMTITMIHEYYTIGYRDTSIYGEINGRKSIFAVNCQTLTLLLLEVQTHQVSICLITSVDMNASKLLLIINGVGGWLVVQRRQDGSIDINRGWGEYEDGFGKLKDEFWYGLRALSCLTGQGNWEIRMDAKLANGTSIHVFL